MPIFPDIRLVFLEESGKFNQEKLCSQDFPEISFFRTSIRLWISLLPQLCHLYNGWTKWVSHGSIRRHVSYMFTWRKISFLPDYREFFGKFSGDFFKTITTLRSFNWNVFFEQTPLFSGIPLSNRMCTAKSQRPQNTAKYGHHLP